MAPSGSWPGRWHPVASVRHRETTHGKERYVMAAGTKEDPWVLDTAAGILGVHDVQRRAGRSSDSGM